MTVVVQISDTHFGTEQAPVVDALVRLVHAQAPDLVIMSGDITQRARASQFRAAKLFLDRLEAPASLVIPGNHDIPLLDLFSRVFRPYANFQRVFGPVLEPMYEDESLLAITVNTTRRYRHIDGEVSQAQIDRVARQLENAKPNQLRIVVTHQPVCVTRAEDKENLLHGHEAAIRAWAESGADVIMGGHIHLPYVCALQSHPLHDRSFNHYLEGLTQRTWAIQAGTAISSRVRHEATNSINIIRYEPGPANTSPAKSFMAERWDYIAAKGRFDVVSAHELTRYKTGDGDR